MVEEKSHHVAWADRIGLNKVWARDIQACSESFGTSYYINCVKRFRNDIVNIKNGPQLSDNIDNYFDNSLISWKKKTLKEWIDSHPKENKNKAWVRDTTELIEQKSYEILCKFMVQLLNNYGFGFYKGEYDGEYDEF
jgi:hypothetical protein